MTIVEGKRVLIVEDESLIAMMLEEILLEIGVVIVGKAFNMENALALAETAQMDAAVLDINIRGARIDPVASTLRARSIPLVFTTGYGEWAEDVADGAPVIDKPYNKERIQGALERCLEKLV
jgi:DNA-binding LytR/AlgR family response regulator